MNESAARELDLLGFGDSPVHRLDARAKLLAAAAFVVCVASVPKYEVAALVPFFAFPVALGAVGRIAPRPVLRLLAGASPFALVVGAFNPLLDRAPRAELLGLPISGGTLSLVSIFLRYLLCTGAALVLVATTSMPALLRAMRQLGAPRPFVAQVQLLYRYLFLLVDEARRLGDARRLREPARRLPHAATARRMLSSLLWRTWERGDRVYACMKVRGFDGTFPLLSTTRFRIRDAVFLAGVAGASVAGRIWPLADLVGRVALGAGAGG